MENRNITYYVLFPAIALILLQGIFLLRESSKLKESRVLIGSILNEVRESKRIIERQGSAIDDLIRVNHELANKVNKVDSTNVLIKKNIDANFYNANKTIKNIKTTIDEIKTIQIH